MLALGLAGCPESEALLAVDVRAELAPGVEFDAVRTEVLTGDATGRFAERAATAGEPYAAGVRVAELGGLSRGVVTVRVTLSRAGALVMQRPLRVELTGASHAVTALFARDCVGVACPIPGGDPIAAACVGGMCQDARCTEETPEFCAPECTSAADCGSTSSCATAECTASGSCFVVTDDARCDPGQTCDAVEGCIGGPAPLCDPFPGADLALQIADRASCVVSSDRPLRCWGENLRMFGGPLLPIVTPREVVLDLDLAPVALGRDFLCGVDAGGAVWCNGNDWAGQLGDGDGETETTSALVRSVLPAGGTAIGAGAATACAIVAGAAYCWGHGDAGQTGTGRVVEEEWVPAPVVGGLSFARLVPGHSHTCGLTTDRELYCWGSNHNEQLGYPVGMPVTASEPQPAPRAGPWVDVSPGDEFTVAIDADGRLWSWGSNVAGQLGRAGARGGTPTPGLVEAPGPFVDVEAGWRHACAVTAGGALYCWGDDTWDQLGPDAPLAFSETPVRVLAERVLVGVEVGESHSCALDDTGRVWCWGDNSLSQLGVPSSPGGPEPRTICPP